MGDGKEVHQLVLERIGTDPALANVVTAYPVSRFASAAMIEKAEAVTGHRQAAEAIARESGYEAVAADREAGVYVGKVIAVTERFVVQDVGMQRAVLHKREDLLLVLHQVKVDEALHIRYRGGHGMIKSGEASNTLER